MISICYVTSRMEPHIGWFFDSLHSICRGDYSDIRVIIVDFYAQAHGEWTDGHVTDRLIEFRSLCRCPNYIHVAPKPTPWQGPFRLTKHDYFAAANSRNTGICHCPDPFIAFVDDLSVLMPDWLRRAKASTLDGQVTCGAFRKVHNLRFGDVSGVTFEDYKAGRDPRWNYGSEYGPMPCAPQWFFGCSLVAPIEAFLQVNGYPESADGMGYEDCVTGQMIARHGYTFWYDQKLLTYEDEGAHHLAKPMLRIDKGVSPNDKSHAFLKLLEGAKESGNPFNLREMRNSTLSGVSLTYPIRQTHDWYDGMPLSEM